MSTAWMKEHSSKIIAGVIVVAVLLLVAVPYVRGDDASHPTCAGASCPVKSTSAQSGDQAAATSASTSGMKSGSKALSILDRMKMSISAKK